MTYVVTLGRGRNVPQGSEFEVADAAGLAALLDQHRGPDAWWSAHRWRGSYREKDRWQSASAASTDFDAQNDARLAPETAARACEALRRVANLVHSSPHGIRAVFLFTAEESDADIFFAAARGAARLVAKTLAEAGIDGLSEDKKATTDTARMFFAPRASVPCKHDDRDCPAQREATCILGRAEPWATAELSALDVAEPARERLMPPARASNGTSAWARAAFEREIAAVRSAPEGDRNNQLNKSSFALGQIVAGGGLERAGVEAALEATALEVGLSMSETRSTIRSGMTAGAREPRRKPEREPQKEAGGEPESASGAPPPKGKPPPQSGGRAVVARMSDVAPRAPRFLWWPRLPRKTLTLLDADPGTGKSTLMRWCAATVSRGGAWPDGAWCAAGNVLLVGDEDGLETSVRPHLELLGANLERIYAVRGVTTTTTAGGRELVVALEMGNVELLAEALRKYRPALVVFDPVQAHIGAKVDINRANEVRPVLAGLARLAEEYDASIALVRHMSKGGAGDKAMYRGLGSIDFMGAARSALALHRHPDQARPDVRVLLHTKANASRMADPLSFEISDGGRLTWLEETDVTEADLRAAELGPKGKARGRGRPGDAREAAAAWLLEILTGGPMETQRLLARGEDAGHTESTLRRAAGDLGILIRRPRPGKGGAPTTPGTWELPAEPADLDPDPTAEAEGAPASAPNSDTAPHASASSETPATEATVNIETEGGAEGTGLDGPEKADSGASRARAREGSIFETPERDAREEGGFVSSAFQYSPPSRAREEEPAPSAPTPAAALIAEARAGGGEVWAAGSELRVRMPAGAFDLYDRLQRHKAAVLAELERQSREWRTMPPVGRAP